MHVIALVEDNQDLRESLEDYLRAEGFTVHGFGSAEAAAEFLESHACNLAVIDINLPGMSGFELIKQVRETNRHLPLIALTARDAVADKVRGFESGLTDYVVKPFSLAELTARIRAHLRKQTPDSTDIKTRHLLVRPNREDAVINDQTITLTSTEYRLLACLARNNGSIVASDDLIAEAWGEADRYNNMPLRIHIRNIRKKLPMDIIKTKAGSGYMLDDL